MRASILNLAFHRWNPFLRAREVRSYADMLVDLRKRGKIPRDARVCLRGSGLVPERVRQKVGEPAIVFRNDVLDELSREDIQQVLHFGMDARSGGELIEARYRARCEDAAILVEQYQEEGVFGHSGATEAAAMRLAQRCHLEWERLVRLHRHGLSAVMPADGESVAGHRQRSIQTCVLEALRIAQEEIAESVGLTSDHFAVVLAAGIVRGPSLFSDVDFLVVAGDSAADCTRYCDMLAQHTRKILTACGLKADNLVERFSDGRFACLAVNDFEATVHSFREADAFVHALVDRKRLEGVGSGDVYRRLCSGVERILYARSALWMRHWRTFYLRQYLRKLCRKSDCVVPASVWLRDLTLFHTLARTYLHLAPLRTGNSSAGSPAPYGDGLPVEACSIEGTLDRMQSIGQFSREECMALGQAHEYFVWLRNEVGLLHNEEDCLIRKRDFARIGAGSSGHVAGEELLGAYIEYSEVIERALGRMQSIVGHGRWSVALLDLWAGALSRGLPILQYLSRGDARVSIGTVGRAGREAR